MLLLGQQLFGALRRCHVQAFASKPVHGPTESLAREVADIIRAQRRNMAKLRDADREKVRGPIQEALIKFSRESEIGFLLAHSLATSKPVFDEAPMTRLYPRSPWFALREPNAALGFLAARAEYAALAETPPTSPDTFKCLICRAGVVYAGLCHMLALVGAKMVPSVAPVCVTAEEPPLVAFGTTIGEKRGSAAKERIRSAREHDIRRANPGTVFGIEVMAWFDELGVIQGRRQGHCAEGVSFPQVAPQVRTALAAGLDVYTVSFSLDKSKIVNPATGNPRWRTLRSVSRKQRFDRKLVDNVGAARDCGVNRAENNVLCAGSSVHRSSKTTGRETATGGKNVWRIPPGTGLRDAYTPAVWLRGPASGATNIILTKLQGACASNSSICLCRKTDGNIMFYLVDYLFHGIKTFSIPGIHTFTRALLSVPGRREIELWLCAVALRKVVMSCTIYVGGRKRTPITMVRESLMAA
ncbi:hypothetical protein FB451DRAFT_1487154 [Mycena latifolia]|nr:hypothetical protein FB451DRAFT_1487154 [Mycena latifolia]